MATRGPLITLGAVAVLAILLTVPVIIHCIYAPGFRATSARVLPHSELSCLFCGAFLTTILSPVLRDAMLRWVLPVHGDVVFASLFALWATLALWLFATPARTPDRVADA
jgi:hypothetical protein